MDPVNIIILLNIVATFGANVSGAQRGLKSKVLVAKDKPKTYLQKLPLLLSAFTIIALIFAAFQIGTLEYVEKLNPVRYSGLIVYLFFSWFQIWAFKALGENYTQEIMIKKDHQLVTKGPFKIIRHPQYLSQILLDLGAAAATLSYVVFALTIVEIPFIIMRAIVEEKMMTRYFGSRFEEYKKKTGFILPFIG
jgi:protein-S-isoprenylcysteine O-methyltransferase Ste14